MKSKEEVQNKPIKHHNLFSRLTIDKIISTLEKEEINSKMLVIQMLRNANKDDLLDLANDCMIKIMKQCPFNSFKENYEEEKSYE